MFSPIYCADELSDLMLFCDVVCEPTEIKRVLNVETDSERRSPKQLNVRDPTRSNAAEGRPPVSQDAGGYFLLASGVPGVIWSQLLGSACVLNPVFTHFSVQS